MRKLTGYDRTEEKTCYQDYVYFFSFQPRDRGVFQLMLNVIYASNQVGRAVQLDFDKAWYQAEIVRPFSLCTAYVALTSAEREKVYRLSRGNPVVFTEMEWDEVAIPYLEGLLTEDDLADCTLMEECQLLLTDLRILIEISSALSEEGPIDPEKAQNLKTEYKANHDLLETSLEELVV
jgi:hypothetical protein